MCDRAANTRAVDLHADLQNAIAATEALRLAIAGAELTDAKIDALNFILNPLAGSLREMSAALAAAAIAGRNQR